MTKENLLIHLGKNIKELRLKKALTQNELAIHCKFEKASLSRIESGKTNMTILTLRKICEALDVDIKEIFHY